MDRPSSERPASSTARIVPIDALRGAAVMGILLMNVAAFAMPFAAYDNPAAYGPMRGADVAVWAVELVLVDGKMRAIFSALFGASLLIVADRAEAAGASAARVHYARMGVLLLFGLAHACLLWDGDILVLYALVGMVAFALRRLPVERMLVLAAMLLATQAAILGMHYQALAALGHAATRSGAAPADVAAWRALIDQIGPPRAPALAADLALHRGPWAPLARSLAAGEPAAILNQIEFSGFETLGLMLLGMAGLRAGFLAGQWPVRAYARIAAIAYAIGLPMMAGFALVIVRAGFPPLMTATPTDLAAMPLRWVIAAGHAALLVAWCARGRSALRRRLAAVGRVALSNYLGTSLAMTALFDGWGLGLYGRVERWMLLPIVLAAWLLMLAWSAVWLQRFAYGPCEWAWRALARRKVPPLRRRAIAS